MNETTKADTFNTLVRSIVTLALTAGFIYGFYIGRIGGDIFVTMYGVVLGFWFGSRDMKSRSTDTNGHKTGETEVPKRSNTT